MGLLSAIRGRWERTFLAPVAGQAPEEVAALAAPGLPHLMQPVNGDGVHAGKDAVHAAEHEEVLGPIA